MPDATCILANHKPRPPAQCTLGTSRKSGTLCSSLMRGTSLVQAPAFIPMFFWPCLLPECHPDVSEKGRPQVTLFPRLETYTCCVPEGCIGSRLPIWTSRISSHFLLLWLSGSRTNNRNQAASRCVTTATSIPSVLFQG